MAREGIIRSGEITLEDGDKVYTAGFDLLRGGVVRLQTGQAAHLRGLRAKELARRLLREAIDMGIAETMGKPKGLTQPELRAKKIRE
jgi:hypothetical protein